MLQTSTITTATIHNGPSSGGSDWRHRAACRGQDPELFHPVGDDGPAVVQIAAAKAVCRRCPVNSECLSFALVALPDGVAGGLTGQERAQLRRAHRGRRTGEPEAEPARAPAGVDELVVAQLVGGQSVSGASAQELALAAIELHRSSGRGSGWIATRLGVHDRQVYRWLERHRSGKPLAHRSGRISRVSV